MLKNTVFDKVNNIIRAIIARERERERERDWMRNVMKKIRIFFGYLYGLLFT